MVLIDVYENWPRWRQWKPQMRRQRARVCETELEMTHYSYVDELNERALFISVINSIWMQLNLRDNILRAQYSWQMVSHSHHFASHLISYHSFTHSSDSLSTSVRRARSANYYLNIFRTSKWNERRRRKKKKETRRRENIYFIFSNSIWNVTSVLAAPFYVLFNTHRYAHTATTVESK